jgi:hypothetical protein
VEAKDELSILATLGGFACGWLHENVSPKAAEGAATVFAEIAKTKQQDGASGQ